MRFLLLLISLYIVTLHIYGQTYKGIVKNTKTGTAITNVEVKIIEENISVFTDNEGAFEITAQNSESNTISFIHNEYMFEEFLNAKPETNMAVALRKKIPSSASKRWETYMNADSCISYKNVTVPDNPEWKVAFVESELKGDLAPDSKMVRRDPSAVIKVDGLYYVWYTKGEATPSTWFRNDKYERVFPWDMCDVWYATSTDGWTWDEKGSAVERGDSGRFDDQSVFTPEVFVHKGKYYLVYQVVQAPYIARVKNTVAMATAASPNGPWTKLPAPILRPTNNGIWTEGSTDNHDADIKGDFDSHKVHDPCLHYYKNKFYLYYKGERMGEERFCGEREIKWGVAIADNPEGPYIKSEYNPITNTGHEVIVWQYQGGVAIIQKLDGPEIGTVQYAKDGINFEIMSSARHVPDAFGVYRPDNTDQSPTAGIEWGLCHVNRWKHLDGGWNHLRRFDLIKE